MYEIKEKLETGREKVHELSPYRSGRVELRKGKSDLTTINIFNLSLITGHLSEHTHRGSFTSESATAAAADAADADAVSMIFYDAFVEGEMPNVLVEFKQ
uniref:CHRD domain-containing protein n=1 Tax=Syphacia muris TaxID=451379 RepID=A0A158R5M3_9BILA